MSIAPVPFFPVPPPQYTQQYMAEVVRAFSVFATQITNPAIAKPILIEIPASSLSGDEVGTVYESNTVLRLKSATAAKILWVCHCPHIQYQHYQPLRLAH